MKTPIELAAEHAYAYVASRGWRVEPLTWEEVKVLLEELDWARLSVCGCEDAA